MTTGVPSRELHERGEPNETIRSVQACRDRLEGNLIASWQITSLRFCPAPPSPLELARAISDYGAVLRRDGAVLRRADRRVQARIQLERALDLAHHLGGRRIANQAREELDPRGRKATTRRDAITGRDALTASELRVARLAAEGLTSSSSRWNERDAAATPVSRTRAPRRWQSRSICLCSSEGDHFLREFLPPLWRS
jgi:hypothetical protein